MIFHRTVFFRIFGAQNLEMSRIPPFYAKNDFSGTIAPTIVKLMDPLVFWPPFCTFSIFWLDFSILELGTTLFARKYHFPKMSTFGAFWLPCSFGRPGLEIQLIFNLFGRPGLQIQLIFILFGMPGLRNQLIFNSFGRPGLQIN